MTEKGADGGARKIVKVFCPHFSICGVVCCPSPEHFQTAIPRCTLTIVAPEARPENVFSERKNDSRFDTLGAFMFEGIDEPFFV